MEKLEQREVWDDAEMVSGRSTENGEEGVCSRSYYNPEPNRFVYHNCPNTTHLCIPDHPPSAETIPFLLNMMPSNARKARVAVAATTTGMEMYVLHPCKSITSINQIFIHHELLWPF